MLNVTDSRTGRPVEVTGARRGLLKVSVHLVCPGGAAGIADLRALVVADVLRRVVESHGRQVVAAVDRPELTDDQVKVLDRATAALGIPAPMTSGPSPDIRADVAVHADGARPVGGAATPVAVAGVPGWPSDAGLPGAAGDAQTVRLAMLGQGHGEPAALTPDRLADAGDTLAAWRRGVADWSREPSKPLPGEIRTAARAALAADLDTPKVLDLLRHVAEAPGIAPGSKFELFADLDRYLALELSRDIGG